MKTKINLFLFFTLFFSFFLSISLKAQSFQTDLSDKVKRFRSLSTREARKMLSQFSLEELETAWSEFKTTQSIQNQRMFWLVEEFESRNADQKASNRLKFTFLAVTLLMALIAAFVLFSWRKITKVEKMLKKLDP